MSLLSDIRRQALTKGLFGGSRPWLLLGIAAWTFRGLQWALRPEPKVVYRSKLEVGETIVLTNEPAAPTRRQRKKLRKAEKRSDRKAERLSRRA
ncbi:unannotated protein [freshwater metagenome]|jgi:hypothetical protein|uniref:Unannotated protein n=1 Tax=freshwater metagenome TaxID=449393 RepID=A0A6J6H6D4_9ZZZZ|nr:hypothetical protein [Actinomycetota bacterium]MSZ23732.1 hypothetical protein [Actinomycetota bacterium]MSZ93571.1 hypothetical protein [Actinomycetota bacterium]